MANPCACGCGQDAGVFNKTKRTRGHIKGEPRKFIQGHNLKAVRFKRSPGLGLRDTHCHRGHALTPENVVLCKSGLRTCKPCRTLRDSTEAAKRRNNDRRYRREYGISLEERDQLLAAQGGVCLICKRTLDGSSKDLTPSVDHIHGTKIIRGLLCSNCNVLLGMAKDSTEILQSAITYLNKHQQETQACQKIT